MKKIILNIEDHQYSLFLRFLQTLDYVKIEETKPKSKAANLRRFDFSDLVGKLEWKGDALNIQREMRNEW